MPAPKLNQKWLLLTALILGLLIMGLLHGLPRPARTEVTSSTPARSAVPATVMPVLPPVQEAVPASPQRPAAAQTLPKETAAWIADRFPGSRLVEQRTSPAAADGTVQRAYLLDTHFKYPSVEVRETWQRAAGAPNETLVVREAWVADHFLLKLRPGVDLAALEAAVAQGAGTLDQTTLARQGLLIVRLAQANLGTVQAAVAAFSKANGPAVYAEPDYLVFTSALPNDPAFAQQYSLDDPPSHGGDINAVAGWNLRTSAAGVLVAVIDTGVRYTHQDLIGNIWQNAGEIAGNGVDDDGDGMVDDVNGVNFYANTGNPSDDYGHGTHVAGILGARGNNGIGITGVAWQVTILPVKFQDSHGSGTSSDAVRSVDFAVAKGASILNASWGSASFSQALHDSIAAASDAGVLCVAAAGNDGANTDLQPVYPAGFDVENVISVGNQYYQYPASSSNYGAKSVDLFAPGTYIYSLGYTSDTAYATLTGTSQAAPLVSGVLALLKAQFPSQPASWLKKRVLETTKPNSTLYASSTTGGELDLYNALANVIPAPVAITTQPAATSDNSTGETLVLAPVASGGGRVQYQWYKDGVALAGQTGATLSLANLQLSDAGEYYLVVRNYASTVTSSHVTVTVKASAPQLTLAPEGVQALAGQRVDLRAAFKGSLPMTFQWEFNGNPVSGATTTALVLDPFTAAQQGEYRVRATNAYGSLVSDPVAVTEVESYLEDWEQVAPHPTAADFQNVAWLNGGFVAVGGGTVALSGDGVQWRLAPAVTPYPLRAVTYGNGLYVAVGVNGTILTSTDGAQWVVRASGSTQDLRDVTFGNGTFVAVTDSTTYRSTDGIHWTPGVIDATGPVFEPKVAFGNGRFVLTGPQTSSLCLVFYSTDGVTWDRSSLQVATRNTDVTFGDGAFWLTGDGYARSSTDGATWTLYSPYGYGTYGRLVPGGDWLYSCDSSRIVRIPKDSSAGAGQTLVPYGSPWSLAALAVGDGRVAVVGGKGTLLVSTDGVTFADVSNFTTSPLAGIVYVNGQFIAVDLQGKVFASPTGSDWVKISTLPQMQVSPVSLNYGNGVIVAYTGNHQAYCSTDGVQWTSYNVPQTRYFSYTGMTFVGDSFWIAPDVDFNVPGFRSADGQNWTSVAKVPLVYGGGRYLRLEVDSQYNAHIAVSTDGTSWQISDFPGARWTSFGYFDGKFHALDSYNYMTSSDGVTWTSTPLVGMSGITYTLLQEDGMFVAATSGGIYLSLDGSYWVRVASQAAARLTAGTGIVLSSLPDARPPQIIRALQPPAGPVTAPVVVTNPAASGVQRQQATLGGTVDSGGADTTVSFEWGTTADLGASAIVPLTYHTRRPEPFSIIAKNLQPQTLYYYRIRATNSVGTALGATKTFTTVANTPPVAVDDGPLVLLSTAPQEIAVLANDHDADADPLSVVSFTQPAHGTVTASANGLTYTPEAGFHGADAFTYTIADSLGATATGTARVRVNAAPTAMADSYEGLVGAGPFVLHIMDNDGDPDGDLISLASFTAALHGTVARSPGGLTYTPAAGFSGDDEFTYTIADSSAATATATVMLRVRSNAAPIATADSYEDLVGAGPFLLPVLDNDRDPDGDALHLVHGDDSSHGTATISGQTVSYTPRAGYSGQDQFSYLVSDPYGMTASVTVTLRVTQDRPGAPGVALLVSSGETVFQTAPGVTLPAGTKLTGFGPPALSDHRQVAATVTLSAVRSIFSGILLQEEDGSNTVLAATASPAPGVAPAQFLSFSHPVLAPHGRVAFIARTKMPGARGAIAQGIWSDAFSADGSLALVLKSGTAVTGPGWPAGASLAAFTSVEAIDGALYVLGQLSSAGGAVLLRIDSAGTHPLLREKGTLTPGVVIQRLSVLQPALASAGQGRWGGAGGLVAKATLSDHSTALLSIAPDGSISRLLSTWQAPAPGDSLVWSGFGLPALTPDGGAAFSGIRKTTAKQALGWRGIHTTDSSLAEVGETATAAGLAQYSAFYDPVVGERGLAFLAILRGPGVSAANRVGLWWNDFSAVRKLAQLGDPAPDASGQVITPASKGPRWLALSSLAVPGGTEAGPVVLGKVVGPGVNAFNNTGLWALDSNGVFRQLLRTGPAALAQDPRSIRSIAALAADAGAFGVGRSYNSTGSLAVKVVLSDGAQALLRLDVP